MNTMFECNKKKISDYNNNITLLSFLKTLMLNDDVSHQVLTRVTSQEEFERLLAWHHQDIKQSEIEYQCGFYMFKHLSLYYSVIQLCCEFDSKCLQLAVTNEAFISTVLTRVIFSPIYFAECVNFVSE